jgi:dolichol-phosphate mannosyltransferase
VPELSVVVPVLNERDNVSRLLNALDPALAGIDYEVIYVDDDSPDDTAAAVRAIAQINPKVRIIQRIHRGGLSSAVLEGFMSSSAPYCVVIDGDLQHDESIIPQMLEAARARGLDLAIGSRNIGDGSMGEFSKKRVALSNLGRRLSRLFIKEDITDPMSGFFLVDRKFLSEVMRNMSTTSFKVLLDMVASARRPVRFVEIGYTFRLRTAGESKLNVIASLEYLKLVIDKLVGHWIPVNFVLFSFVGGAGVLIYLGLVASCLHLLGLQFRAAAIISGSVVIAVNFFFNNALTYRSSRLSGSSLLAGLAAFYVSCLIGLMVNVWVASSLLAQGTHWVLASIVGIILSSVWNYWITSVFVWKLNQRGGAR